MQVFLSESLNILTMRKATWKTEEIILSLSLQMQKTVKVHLFDSKEMNK